MLEIMDMIQKTITRKTILNNKFTGHGGCKKPTSFPDLQRCQLTHALKQLGPDRLMLPKNMSTCPPRKQNPLDTLAGASGGFLFVT